MYNKITLIGRMLDHPSASYDPEGNTCLCMKINIPPPSDAPPTYWGVIYDLRSPAWPTGEDTFLVICRDIPLVERCLMSLQKGDIVCVEGRLVLTLLRSEGQPLPLAEILASDVILLSKQASVQ